MSNLATIVNNILADSGIDDINVVVTTGSYTNPSWIVSLPWTKITGTPTTLAGYGITDAVPSSRTISINGTTQDLSANRTYNVGTVTSVGLSAPTGFSVANSPVTGAGTLALSFASGFSLPTNASQANWDAAYNDKINSAAVTGTTTKTLTLTQQDGGTITASWTDINTDAVTSVFGRIGAVVAANGDYTTAQVTESGNLYFTNARSRAALSFVAGSGAYNSTTGVITIPTNTSQLTNGANFITLASLSAGAGISYNNTTGVIASTITQYTDALARLAISLTTTGASGASTYNNTTGVLNVPTYTLAGLGGQPQLNGTGFVKASGTTITYDNSTYQVTSEKAQPNGYASLDSNGKVPLVQINDALIGNVNFQGLWNAATNTPTLANPPASGTKGYYYIVSTAGTFAGISFEVGDWIISNGTAWGKVDNTDAVSSVFGRTGNVTATNGDYNTSQVTELTNLYYTEARVNANTNVAANTAARHNAVTLGTANGLSLSTQALSLQLATSGQNGALSSSDWTTFNNKENAITAGTTAQYFRGDKTFQTLNTGVVPESGNLYFTNARAIASVLTGYTSGAGTISAADSILSAIQKLNGNIGALVTGVSSVNGLTGVVVLSTTNIAEGTNLYYTEARVNANTNVAANTAARHAAVTLGTANGLSLNVQQLSLGLASAGVTGALSGTDWSTFNSKQNALTNPVTGTGSAGQVAFWSSGSQITGESNLFWDAANDRLGIGTAIPTEKLDVNGNVKTPYTGAFKIITDFGGAEIYSKGISGLNQSTSVARGLHIYNYEPDSNQGIVFYVSSSPSTPTQRMRITASGRVLIGTPPPTESTFILDVDGTVRITGASLFSSTITATQFIRSGGTSSQFLKADGSVDSNTYYLASNPSAFIALTALSGTAPIQYNNTTGAISITQASGSTNGFLSSTDWNTFNNKTSNVGTVTSVAALTLGTSGTDLSSSVANGTTTPVITLNVPTASAANRGALSAADWTTFNSKENAITAGTTAQYYRGDKTFQTLNTAAVPELTNLYYTEARVNANANVAANTAARHNAVTLGTANGLSLSTQQLSLGLASSSANGALSSTDWTTFNNKQNALTNPVTGTGTTRQVAYFNGTSSITSESNLFWDDTNDRLGIGTSTPATNLQVSSTNSIIRISNTTSGLSNADLDLGVTSTGLTRVWQYGNYAMVFATNNTERMRLDASGNLGLGVTPSAWASAIKALQIGNRGNLVFGFGGLFNTNNAFFNGSNWIYQTSNASTLYELASSSHIWYTALSGTAGDVIAFTQAMTLGSNRGLSIGTPSAAPAQGLLVQGAATFSSSVTATGLLTVTNTNSITLNNSTHAGENIFIRSSGLGAAINNLTSLLAFGKNDGASLRSGAAIGGIQTTADADQIGISFYTSPSSASSQTLSEAMRITHSGNVGIGTASPGGKLQIADGSSGTINNSTTLYVENSGSSNSFYVLQTASIGGGKSFSITNAGNVGIGTTSPQQLLHISASNASMQVQSTTAGQNANVRFVTTARTWAIGPNQYLGNSSFEIVDSTAGAPRVVVVPNGNVLIGTTTDAGFKLDVNGTGRFSSSVTAGKITTSGVGALPSSSLLAEAIVLIQDSGSNRRLGIGSSTSGQWIQSSYPGFDGIASTLLLNPSGGNVGVGGVLDLNSNSTPTSINDKFALGVSGSSYAWIQSFSGTPLVLQGIGNNVLIGTQTDAGFRLDVNGTGRFSGGLTGTSANFSGNVGIGTNSTSNRLDLQVANKSTIVATASGINVNYSGSTTGQFQTIGFSWDSSISTRDSYWGMGFTGTNYSAGTGNLFFFTNGATRLTIASSGAASFSSTLLTEGNLTTRTTNSPTQSILLNAIPVNDNSISLISFGARFNSTTYGTGAQIRASAAGTWSSTNYGTNLIFSTVTQNTDVNTERLIISASGTVRITNLAGSGSRMVVADANGLLSTQAISAGIVTNVTASSPLFSSGGATPNITIQQASGSQNGFLSSTDWTTFNNKVSGSATAGQVAYWSSGSAITGESNLFWDATNDRLGIGTATPAATLEINGNIRTGAPTGGTAVNWRLGTARGGTVTTNATVRVEIDGVLVDLVARYV